MLIFGKDKAKFHNLNVGLVRGIDLSYLMYSFLHPYKFQLPPIIVHFVPSLLPLNLISSTLLFFFSCYLI